ncbi:MAG: polyprenyl synthetase family protein [Planctomycetota bacterium]
MSTKKELCLGGQGGRPDWYVAVQQRVDNALSTHLKKLEAGFDSHSRLGDAVHYSVALPGKRVRPVLVLESCRLCGGDDETALAAGIALECVHVFSLIHDDLPAMDDDELRRGQPCNHKVFGEALAILAGDWLAAYPFALLAREYPPELAARLTATLANGMLGMVEGQSADVVSTELATDPELVKYIHLHKTARLLEVACRMGGLCAGAHDEVLEAVTSYGRHLGLAFQIADDLLDVTGNTATLGKQVGKDANAAKQTYPAAFGVEQSRTRAWQEITTALDALKPFGESAQRLRQLAQYVVIRDR